MKRIIIVLVVLGLILLTSSLYTVNETQVAIKLILGEIVAV
jgi:regulator of protease activity HflC (stomatin/prohibitin superfamily)